VRKRFDPYDERPYVREDMQPGSTVRMQFQALLDRESDVGPRGVAKLLATIDHLYEVIDGKVPICCDKIQTPAEKWFAKDLIPGSETVRRARRPRPVTSEEHRQEALRLVEMSTGPYGDAAGAKWLNMARRHIEVARLLKTIEEMA
jgi:hypothetical protein